MEESDRQVICTRSRGSGPGPGSLF